MTNSSNTNRKFDVFKKRLFGLLVLGFLTESYLVYTSGTEYDAGSKELTEEARTGKLIFQKYNCIACHQLYGLGGYMGPDLTNIISTKGKGENYARAFIEFGTQKMPNFEMSHGEINELLAYLKYVDKTGISPVTNFEIENTGIVKQYVSD